jgi:PTS system nitrogen regulatory IIA component
MRITDILSEELILPDVVSTAKEPALQEVVERIARVRKDIDGQTALRVLIERERLGSTGVGNGLAIPHGKLATLRGIVACFARSRHGVAFGSLDGQPAHLLFTLLAPEGAAGLHLKALARASRLFKDPDFRRRLLEEPDKGELWRLIAAEDARLAKADEVRG